MELSDSRSQPARLLLSSSNNTGGSLNSHHRNCQVNNVPLTLSMASIKSYSNGMNQSDAKVNACDDDGDGSDSWRNNKDSGGAKHSDSFQILNTSNNVYDNYCINDNDNSNQIGDSHGGDCVRDSDEPIANSLYDRLSMFVERSSKTIPSTTAIRHQKCCSKLVCWKYLVFVFCTIAWFSSFGTCLAARQEGK